MRAFGGFDGDLVASVYQCQVVFDGKRTPTFPAVTTLNTKTTGCLHGARACRVVVGADAAAGTGHLRKEEY